MSFIENGNGKIYAPGYFLAHEECVRVTQEIPQDGAVTADNGGKYVPMGTIYPSNDAYATGIVYEDVDVTAGNMPGSVVTKGVVYEDRLAITGMTFEAATVTPADNPTTESWYEDGDSGKTASSDTYAKRNKKYYTRSGSSPDYTYTQVETIVYGDNPKALGLYESDGGSPATYTLSTDEQAIGSKTYYEVSGYTRMASAAKSALEALGFTFVTEPTVTR